MIKYTVIQNNTSTNTWTSEFADETYYEPCFGKPERWVVEYQEDISNAIDTREIVAQEATEESEYVDEETSEIITIPAQPAVTYTEYLLEAEYTIEIEDITQAVDKAANIQSKILAGESARRACQSVLDYIAGANLDKELSIEQITQMQQTFANAEAALRAGRPSYAKYYISAITPDGIIVTSEEKQNCLDLLAGY